jgi:hypothetical protein
MCGRGGEKVFKEVDAVVLPPGPPRPNGGGCGKQALEWPAGVHEPTVATERLGDSERFESLDQELAVAVMHTAKGALGRRLRHLAATLAQKGRLLTGKQCLQ